ncbi:MAG: ABC transporter substrate-binding protein [Thermoprotei archaeon]
MFSKLPHTLNLRANIIQILLLALIFASVLPLSYASPSMLPPFSIYGAPSPPSSKPILNVTGEYWGPYIGQIYVTWFTTSEAAIEALVNGYIQYDSQGITNIQEYNQLEGYANIGQVGLNSTPFNGFYFIGFKYNSYPFNNTYFRLGIQRLINYQQVASSLYNGILGVSSPYYFLPTLYSQYFSAQQAQAYKLYGSYNLTAAIQDFEMAGLVYHPSSGYWSYSNGTKVSLQIYVPSSQEDLEVSMLSSLVYNAESINMSISITPVSTNTLIYSLLPTQSAEMYLIGVGFGPPATPTYAYTLLGPTPFNQIFIHYTNSTAWTLLSELYNSPTEASAISNAGAAGVFLQQNVPIIILSWTTVIVPVSLVGWSGYIFQQGVGYAFPGDIHPAGLAFGGLFRYADAFPPSDPNIYTQVSTGDYAVLSMQWLTPLQLSYDNSQLYPWAVYNWSVTPSSGVMPNGHYYNGSIITFHFLHNIVWQDGAPLTALDLNFTIWYLDVGGFTSNPYNPTQDTIEYAPGVTINLTATALNPSPEWFGTLQGLAGTYVPKNDTYTIEIYMNTSSIFNLERPFPSLWSLPIIPEHIFYNVSEATYASEPASAYLGQQVMAGPYMLKSYSLTSNYVQLVYFPSYFLANPYTNIYSVQEGGVANFKVNLTVFGDQVQQTSTGYSAMFNHPTNAAGYVYVLDINTLTPIASYPLSSVGGGVYQAQITTSSLPVGEYYLVAQLNWTGKPYYYYTGSGNEFKDTYYYHVYGVLNVSATQTETSTSTPSTTTSTQSTQPTTSTTGVVSSVHQQSIVYIIAVIVIIIIIVAVLLIRRSYTAK